MITVRSKYFFKWESPIFQHIGQQRPFPCDPASPGIGVYYCNPRTVIHLFDKNFRENNINYRLDEKNF